MPTMPVFSPSGQPSPVPPRDWFATPAGQMLLSSETDALRQCLGTRLGLPWLWLSPAPAARPVLEGRGLHLVRTGPGHWGGDAICALPLPLPSEVFGSIVLQHVLRLDAPDLRAELSEFTRLLAPGGRLWLFALNPLSPYRWHWRGSRLNASEPGSWRRRLRQAGLAADTVSRGLGPSWRPLVEHSQQTSAGLRAAYLLSADKRQWPLTPIRQRQRRALPQRAPAL